MKSRSRDGLAAKGLLHALYFTESVTCMSEWLQLYMYVLDQMIET